MAFNWQTFRTRSLTAVFFVVIMAAGVLTNHWTFFLLFSVIHFGCWREYLKLVERIYEKQFHAYFKLGLMLLGYSLLLLFCCSIYQVDGYQLRTTIALPVTVAGLVLSVAGILKTPGIAARPFVSTVLGVLYISCSLGLMIDLWCEVAGVKFYFVTPGYLLPALIIGSLWVNDTMAYIVGSLIGKTPMSKISPKKTWEGTTGGIILAVVVIGLAIGLVNEFDLTGMIHAASIAAIASITGTFGDLFESKLKRMAKVKDSGRIMPGHGGFLDRFDSMLFATPSVWLYFYFFLR